MTTLTLPAPARTNAGPQFKCVTCEIEIDGRPLIHLGVPFCCAGCAADGPCICSYDDRPSAPQRRTASIECECRKAV